MCGSVDVPLLDYVDDLGLAEAPGDPADMPGPSGSGGPASILVDVPGGKLRYFFSDGRFEATCGNDNHKTAGGVPCRLTRTSCAAGDDLANGRPVGTLAAWLAQSLDVPSREEHRCPFAIQPLPRGAREVARETVAASVNGPALMAHERPRYEGEPDEATEVPMGW